MLKLPRCFAALLALTACSEPASNTPSTTSDAASDTASDVATDTASDAAPSNDATPPSDATPASDASSDATPAMTFTLASGVYRATAVTDFTENCGSTLMGSYYMRDYRVNVDAAAGTVSIDDPSAAGRTLVAGMLRGNTASLTQNAPGSVEGACSFEATRTAMLDATANNTFTLRYTEARDRFMSPAPVPCTQRGPCEVRFTLALRGP